MSKYWSNEDDNQVSYNDDQSSYRARTRRGSYKPADGDGSVRDEEETNRIPVAGSRIARREAAQQYAGNHARSRAENNDRSSFVSEDLNTRRAENGDMQFAPPPKFSQKIDNPPPPKKNEYVPYGNGYQIQSETPLSEPNPKKSRFWIGLIVVLLLLALMAAAAYIFRDQILVWVGDVFGEEVVWKISPTEEPVTETVVIPAYTESTEIETNEAAEAEIEAIADGLTLETYVLTELSIVKSSENEDGSYDFYLFSWEDGLLLGYYEGLNDFIVCTDEVFYIAQEPYLITYEGYPMVDLEDYERSAGGDVILNPIINGWAIISDTDETLFNFIAEDGSLLSDLWFSKAFPFTAETTLAYVDTGSVTNTDSRYALYLLQIDGETQRLSYMSTMDEVIQCVCGFAFMENGDICTVDEEMQVVGNTDDVSAYVNCSALVVRDPDTLQYGLFVDGVQQYEYAYDSITLMDSDLTWDVDENGYVKRYTLADYNYPLPRSYSFILQKGDTQQIVSIAAASEYPIVFDGLKETD